LPQGPVDFLYTNIGRGHPHYLDGILEVLDPSRVGRVDDVFKISWGIGRLGWHLAKSLYRCGQSRAGLDPIYNRLRRGADFENPGFLLKAMAGAVRSTHLDGSHPLIVAHPILVGMLRERCNLVYQHGEIAVPDDAIVSGEHSIFVPDNNAADCFVKAGISSEQLVETGLCIEDSLVEQAEACFSSRLKRLEQAENLTGAFFSSGAEPRRHVDVTVRAALSAAQQGHRVLIFARRSGSFERCACNAFETSGIPLVERTKSYATEKASLCLYSDRSSLNAISTELFDHMDFFMAPSHERTLWALGLGLPMFIAEPAAGTFAPLNRERLLSEGVAQSMSMDRATDFGVTLRSATTDGTLAQMSEAGYQRYDIRGFRNIVKWIQEHD